MREKKTFEKKNIQKKSNRNKLLSVIYSHGVMMMMNVKQ